MAKVTRRDREGLLELECVGNRFCARFTVRTQNGGAQAALGRHELTQLPASLDERYELVDPLIRGVEAELILAKAKSDGKFVVLKFYWKSLRPESGVLERIRTVGWEHVVALREHGEADGRYYEVLDYSEHGTLRDLLAGRRPLSPEMCREIVRQTAAALARFHAPDVRGRCLVHRDVKPENVLVRGRDPLDLVLIDFGVTAWFPSSPERPGRNFTVSYAAPEVLDGKFSPAADFWSLGMIVLESLTGHHPFEGLENAFIERLLRDGWPEALYEVHGAAWRELCLGLLTRDPTRRWGEREVGTWLERASELHFRQSLDVRSHRTFRLGTPDGASLRELLAALILHWEEGVQLFKNGEVAQWLKTGLRNEGLAARAEAILRTEADPHLKLLRFLYTADPQLPPVWKHLALNEGDLAALCRAAMGGDGSAQRMVEEIYRLDVLGELESLSSGRSLGGLSSRWRSTVAEFESGREAVAAYAGPVDTLPPTEAILAHLYLAACDPEVRAQLRADAGRAGRLEEIPAAWLLALGWPPASLPPGRQLIVCLLEPLLEERARRQRRIHYEFSPGTRTEAGEPFRWGRNPPHVAFSRVHTDILFDCGDARFTVGLAVRLSWIVENSRIVYLVGRGRMPLQGERELVIGETAEFTLVAIGSGGFAVSRLPPLVFDLPQLSPAAELSRTTPALLAVPALAAAAKSRDLQPVIRGRAPSLSAKDLLGAIPLAPCLTVVDLASRAELQPMMDWDGEAATGRQPWRHWLFGRVGAKH
ncbi:serine/threonine-protein kinase [Methylocaldum sp. 14B]|jgi:hypothetical protein|uniref:serine/threonine protein kinase n=1 Tax=Methylocaldum sp. 14B TaxID=1912213 RepID=UPI00098B3086|nr:serine/threonine-protein kinase [Methylocaldum sp. 14B]